MKRRMTLTIETHQVQIIRARQRASTLWCAACEARSDWLTPEQTARHLGLSPRWLYQQLEAARLPFVEMTDGTPLICVACLTKTQGNTWPPRSQ
jgi:hypothetical protein